MASARRLGALLATLGIVLGGATARAEAPAPAVGGDAVWAWSWESDSQLSSMTRRRGLLDRLSVRPGRLRQPGPAGDRDPARGRSVGPGARRRAHVGARRAPRRSGAVRALGPPIPEHRGPRPAAGRHPPRRRALGTTRLGRAPRGAGRLLPRRPRRGDAGGWDDARERRRPVLVRRDDRQRQARARRGPPPGRRDHGDGLSRHRPRGGRDRPPGGPRRHPARQAGGRRGRDRRGHGRAGVCDLLRGGPSAPRGGAGQDSRRVLGVPPVSAAVAVHHAGSLADLD